MAGFENDVLVCSNVNFNPLSAKPHLGSIVSDGQLIIGSTALNAGGTHLNIGTLTSNDGSVVITNGPGTINLKASGGVTTVSGTANRITSTGGSTPVIDISASYVGQSSITTVGTIATGVWNGTKVAEGFGGTNQSTYTTGDLLYASASNTLSKLPISTQPGSYLEYNGTNVAWFNPLQEMVEFDDFISPVTTGKLNWQADVPGASGIKYIAGDSGHPGIIQLDEAGGAATLRLFLTSGSQPAPFILGGGYYDITWVAKLSALSNNTDRYLLTVGIFDDAVSSTPALPNHGIYFQYADNLNSGNYTITCGNGGGLVTTANTSTAATTGWTTYRITVNAAASSVAFYINGVQVGNSPITTNIPTINIGPAIGIANIAGVTDILLKIDLCWMYVKLTSAR